MKTFNPQPGLPSTKETFGSTAEGSAAAQISPPRSEITHDRIRARAYEVYRARKGGPGDHLSDWLQAERELKAVAQKPLASIAPGRPQTTHARAR